VADTATVINSRASELRMIFICCSKVAVFFGTPSSGSYLGASLVSVAPAVLASL
jgi:hypothetical protein